MSQSAGGILVMVLFCGVVGGIIKFLISCVEKAVKPKDPPNREGRGGPANA